MMNNSFVSQATTSGTTIPPHKQEFTLNRTPWRLRLWHRPTSTQLFQRSLYWIIEPRALWKKASKPVIGFPFLR